MSIYVVIALEDERVKECIVVESLEKAQELYAILRRDYGGANVALCSRGLNDIPDNIQHAIMKRDMTPEQREAWTGPIRTA